MTHAPSLTHSLTIMVLSVLIFIIASHSHVSKLFLIELLSGLCKGNFNKKSMQVSKIMSLCLFSVKELSGLTISILSVSSELL